MWTLPDLRRNINMVHNQQKETSFALQLMKMLSKSCISEFFIKCTLQIWNSGSPLTHLTASKYLNSDLLSLILNSCSLCMSVNSVSVGYAAFYNPLHHIHSVKYHHFPLSMYSYSTLSSHIPC